MTSDLAPWTGADPDAAPALPAARGSSGVVALVASEGATRAGWAGEVALQLADEWSARGARLVLADGGLEVPTLHTAAGLALGEGLVDALRWGASVRRVARRLKGKSFFVITAGTVTADGLSVLEDPRWAALCSGFQEAGVTLAVLVPIGDPCVRAVLAQATAAVILAAPSEDATDLLPGWDRPILGVVGRESPPPPPTPEHLPDETAPVESAAAEHPLTEPLADAAPLALDVPDAIVEGTREDVRAPFPALDSVTDSAVLPEALPPEGLELALFEVPEVAPEPEVAVAPEVGVEPQEPRPPAPEPASEPPAPPEPDAEVIPVTEDAEAHVFAAVEADVHESVPTFEQIVEETELRHHAGKRRSRAWILLAAFPVLLLAGGGVAWWLGYVEIPGLPRRGPGAEEAPGLEPAVPAGAVAAPAPETSALMGFSVLLGSYRDQAAAEARISELTEKLPGVLFTIVPVQLEEEVVHRVLAGPAADSAEATALGARIAEAAGLGPSEWVARATPRAFELGEMPELDAALGRSEVLRGLGIPSYVLAVTYDDGSVRFRVYAGAYADEAEASYLSGLLQERGLGSATLSDRTGRPPE